jgi:hypothetical protein
MIAIKISAPINGEPINIAENITNAQPPFMMLSGILIRISIVNPDHKPRTGTVRAPMKKSLIGEL